MTGRSLGSETYIWVRASLEAGESSWVRLNTRNRDRFSTARRLHCYEIGFRLSPPARRDMPRTEALAAHPQLKLSDQHTENGVRGYPDRHQSMRKREAEI